MDFQEMVLAIGRGVVKVLTSLFIGSGVGLVTVGYTTMQSNASWDFRHNPPPMGEIFLGVGAGLLAAGLSLVVLFAFGGSRRTVIAPAPRVTEPPSLRDAV